MGIWQNVMLVLAVVLLAAGVAGMLDATTRQVDAGAVFAALIALGLATLLIVNAVMR